jgi:hypothetical protein
MCKVHSFAANHVDYAKSRAALMLAESQIHMQNNSARFNQIKDVQLREMDAT